MSMVLTRSPLEVTGMNGGGTQKRRSARLSHEGEAENEPPAKRSKANGVSTTTVNTKQQDGDTAKAPAKKGRKVYDQDDEGFSFTKGKRGRGKAAREVEKASNEMNEKLEAAPMVPAEPFSDAPVLQPNTGANSAGTAQKKTRRKLPTTPEQEVAEKVARRSKRLSNDNDAAPGAPNEPVVDEATHTKSHANAKRPPNTEKAPPLTVEKKRKHGVNGVEEEKVMTISLPFADTPVIRRNKEMRKNSAESHRRSSAGMRGKRASSLIDEGRGHAEASRGSPISPARRFLDERDGLVARSSSPDACDLDSQSVFAKAFLSAPKTYTDSERSTTALPHAEVPTSEFFKHISADLTEPRRMRCLLGWCGTRSLPTQQDVPQESSLQSSPELQASQIAHAIQEELAQDLITKGTLSDWFSRDESVPPQIPLRKKPNPRNVTNAAKAEELERELERLKAERAEWDEVARSAATLSSQPERTESETGQLSPVRLDVLDSPQRHILEQLQQPDTESAIQPETLHDRLRSISQDLEFSVDRFAHGLHALSSTRETAERVAERSLADAANVLEEREKQRASTTNPVDQMDVLRGLARVLNAQYR